MTKLDFYVIIDYNRGKSGVVGNCSSKPLFPERNWRLFMENKSTIGAEKINALFDAGTFVEIGSYVRRSNRPQEYEGVVCGYGAVDGKLVFAYAQDSDRMKGAFDEIHARKIEKLYEMAIANGAPVVAMLDSAGAVIYDGSAVLSGYGRVMKCVSEASGIIPQIAVVNGVCGGMSATIAAMYDLVVTIKDKSRLRRMAYE